MTLMERELFDIYVFGTAQPHIDGRLEVNKDIVLPVSEEEKTHVREFADKIIEFDSDFIVQHKEPTREERISHLKQLLEMVSNELGDTSLLARDIKTKLEYLGKNKLYHDYYCDDILRIRHAFDLR